ncbi:hypothetical protein J3458_012338 [Metarhizium acridum]|uniref:Uncharacterized protein n=1 Tax=Metarhizium acridum (strain CQMa 102) TaxID=655827 RepID=E9EEG2_METAQ|nr:uncharacterized protein MAC_08260 [Metarhizium acridum CQMa 102]EFY85721.1 hypothetical protein MAC_08260 [Metarhizium acridum CQMa 102]KAG8413851.1 hypothetical protein J3458_012338 [Metarhizium acridum]
MPKTVNSPGPPASEYASSSQSSRSPREKMHPEQEELLDDLWKKYEELRRHRKKWSFCLYPAAFQKRVIDKCDEYVKKHGDLYDQFVERNEKELRDQAELEALRQEADRRAARRAPRPQKAAQQSPPPPQAAQQAERA